MKNKGQVLAVFVILLPILILLVGMLLDYGLLVIDKHEIETKIKHIVKTSLEDNLTEEEINRLLVTNLESIESKEVIVNTKVEVKVTVTLKTIFTYLFNTKKQTFTLIYQGEKTEENIIIKKG